MKRYYYFSNSKLKFVEIKNVRAKLLLFVVGVSFIISAVFFTGYYFIEKKINPESQVAYLKYQNKLLLKKLGQYANQIDTIKQEINSLTATNNELRLKLNLEPLDENLDEYGVGGSVVDEHDYSYSEEARTILDSLDKDLVNITAKVNLEKNNYAEIEKTLKLNEKLYDALPAIRPTDGPIGDRFGMRYHPILKVRRMHNGIDFLVNTGTPVYATGDGTVKFAGRKGGLGRTIIIDHGFGYTTVYGHLHRIKVKKGQHVKRGDLIALSGNSGRLTTGPHLHYEVRHNGIALNPRNFMLDDIKLFDYLATIKKKEEGNK
jgi:murein DD-endopeptidase MepM/ murein hydrolase activator NlpD